VPAARVRFASENMHGVPRDALVSAQEADCLLAFAFDEFARERFQPSKQSVILIVDAGGKEQSVCVCVCVCMRNVACSVRECG
jgi:hypothetical protein